MPIQQPDYSLIGNVRTNPNAIFEGFNQGVDLATAIQQNRIRQQQANQQASEFNLQEGMRRDITSLLRSNPNAGPAEMAQVIGRYDPIKAAGLMETAQRLAMNKQAMGVTQKAQDEALAQKKQAKYQNDLDYIGGVFNQARNEQDVFNIWKGLEDQVKIGKLDPDAFNYAKQQLGQLPGRADAERFIMGQMPGSEQIRITRQEELDRLRAQNELFRQQMQQKQYEQLVKHQGVMEGVALTNATKPSAGQILETTQGPLLVDKKTGQVKPIIDASGVQVTKAVAPKQMSAEAAQKLSLSQGFEDNINELINKMTTGNFQKNSFLMRIPGSDLSRLRKDAMDLLSKLRSGAATGSKEEKIYTELISDFGDLSLDNKQAFLNQMNRFKSQNKYFREALSGKSEKQQDTKSGFQPNGDFITPSGQIIKKVKN